MQEAEFAAAEKGFTAVRHQREVGTGYFDAVTTTVQGSQSSTTALEPFDRGRAVLRQEEGGLVGRQRLIASLAVAAVGPRSAIGARPVVFARDASPRRDAVSAAAARRSRHRTRRPARCGCSSRCCRTPRRARDAGGAARSDVARETGGRATPAENLHLTLAFLGSVPAVAHRGGRSGRRARRGDGGAVRAARSSGVGWFRNAGVAWIGPDAVAPALQQVADALRDALRDAGFALEERAFHPHLTLARRCVRAPAAARRARGLARRRDGADGVGNAARRRGLPGAGVLAALGAGAARPPAAASSDRAPPRAPTAARCRRRARAAGTRGSAACRLPSATGTGLPRCGRRGRARLRPASIRSAISSSSRAVSM